MRLKPPHFKFHPSPKTRTHPTTSEEFRFFLLRHPSRPIELPAKWAPLRRVQEPYSPRKAGDVSVRLVLGAFVLPLLRVNREPAPLALIAPRDADLTSAPGPNPQRRIAVAHVSNLLKNACADASPLNSFPPVCFPCPALPPPAGA